MIKSNFMFAVMLAKPQTKPKRQPVKFAQNEKILQEIIDKNSGNISHIIPMQ